MVSEISESSGRRRRSEARRSIASILDAAVRVLAQHPDASIEEVATAAGVARQTVYAHFATRETLIDAAIDTLTQDITATMDAACLDDAPPEQALERFLLLSWGSFERYPLLLALASANDTDDNEQRRHQSVLARLHDLIRRGQHSGAFDPNLPADWLAGAVVALGHAAGEHVIAGQMSAEQAQHALQTSVLRVLSSTRRPGR